VTVTVDQDLCVGCGLCVGVCPQVFEMSDEGKSRVVAQPADLQAQDGCREAADCPVEAISLKEDT
jgi:ferredoxin